MGPLPSHRFAMLAGDDRVRTVPVLGTLQAVAHAAPTRSVISHDDTVSG
ncbi:MAG: hypothetical protein HC829_02330 [Bacteroidales bacterium]|nr:hypothetical protein [Bacteroidales bacterium]